jgi:hypothetical protein
MSRHAPDPLHGYARLVRRCEAEDGRWLFAERIHTIFRAPEAKG